MADKLERIKRNFLWGTSESSLNAPWWQEIRFVHLLRLVAWGTGRLCFNQALVGKRLWRFGHEACHLWPKILGRQYGGPSTKVSRGLMGVDYCVI